jgi:transcription termination factor Rho
MAATSGSSDVEHDTDVWRRDLGEEADVADAARTGFQHEVSRVRRRAQHRVRVAEFVVERARRCDGRSQPAQDLLDQVLGRRLARRSGDADDGELR